MIESGDVHEDISTVWKAKKKEIDLTKAKKLYAEGLIMDAAKLGLPKAQGKVASWYYNGTNGVEKDIDECLMFAEKAAEGGDMYGQFRLGYAYNAGKGVNKCIPSAILWYEKAAKQGCNVSMNKLGNIYKRGGCELDHNFLQKAARWYKKAANSGYETAIFHIGKICYDGTGVTKDLKEARRWLEKASIGDGKRKSEAQFWFGKMMMKGEGGCKDLKKGIEMIEKSASSGYSEANIPINKMLKTL